MNIKNCAIYTRVSTDNQAEMEFSSCEAQEQKIRSFIASQNDWQVFKIYNDPGFSGAILERPALQELLSDLKKEKIDVVLVYKIDRLTRSPKDFYQLIEFFEQAKIDFISITERFDTSTPAGRLLRNIMLTFSQFERELTSERTKDKMLERAKKGLANGGLTPYGYIRQDKKLISHPKESNEIKSIFETYIETGSTAKTYQMLKDKGIKNKLGKNFSKTNISHILRNVIYFRLNNDIQAGHRAGYELTDGCSKFSTENLSDTLKFFLSGLKTTKGIERNLFAKRFLSNIFYSPESIKIRFISRQSEGVALAERSPTPPLAGLGERTLSSSKSEFVSSLLAPELKPSQTFEIILPNLIHKSKKRNLK